MNSIKHFDSSQAKTLQAFLNAPDRAAGSMSYSEAAGFLYVVACAPELVQPSQWVPIIIDPDNASETSLENMQAIMNGLMSLYNELNQQVQEVETQLLPGCRFREEPMDNLQNDASMSQWARGFRTGYLWLEEMWSDYLSEDLKEEFGYHLTVLSFFSHPDMANAFFKELNNEDMTLEGMAESMQKIFPDAMYGFALLGKSIQQAIRDRDGNSEQAAGQPVVRGKKIGRNEPCTCGSGKKYKKCCGRTLH